MFPHSIISNTSKTRLDPFYNPNGAANLITFRGSYAEEVNRHAVFGTEYVYTNIKCSGVQFLTTNTYNLFANMFPGEKLFLRFRATRPIRMRPWSGASAIFLETFVANTWHELKVEYKATGGSTWVVNGATKYSGTRSGAAAWTFDAVPGGNIVTFDVGNLGGILPDGYRWWYNYIY